MRVYPLKIKLKLLKKQQILRNNKLIKPKHHKYRLTSLNRLNKSKL